MRKFKNLRRLQKPNIQFCRTVFIRTAFIWISLSGLTLSGCSLGGLFSSGPDQKVLKTANYRVLNPDCSFKAENDEIDVPTFRAVFKCLNSHHAFNHALDKTELLLDNMTDTQLEPIVQAGNKYLFTNPTRVYELQSSYQALKDTNAPNTRTQLINPLIQQFGKIAKNGAFVSNAIALVKDGFFVDKPGGKNGDKIPDPAILKAIEILSNEITDEHINDTFTMGLNMSSALAFQQLYHSFKQGLKTVSSLNVITNGLYSYTQTDHKYQCYEQNNGAQNHTVNDIKRDFYKAIRNASLKQVYETIFSVKTKSDLRNTTNDPLKEKISRVALVLHAFSQKTNGSVNELVKRLGVAFQELSAPFSCLKSSVEISSPTLLIVGELIDRMNSAPTSSASDMSLALARYALKENPLSFSFLQEPMCNLPSEKLAAHYPTLRDMALFGVKNSSNETVPLLLPMTEFLQDVYSEKLQPWEGCDGKSPTGDQQHLITQLVLHALSDVDPTLGVVGSPSKGIDFLLPLIDELSVRDAWPDILLVITLPNASDRANIQQLLEFLVDVQPTLQSLTPRFQNGKAEKKVDNLADVVLNAMGRLNNPLRLFNLVNSLNYYISLDDDFLEQVLTQLSYAYQINSAHPLIDVFKDITAEASKNSDLIQVLFEISGEFVGTSGKSDQYFANAVSEFANITDNPDQLLTLLDAVFSISSRFSAQGKNNVQIKKNLLVAHTPQNRHSFTRESLKKFSFLGEPNLDPEVNFKISPACLELNYSVSLLTGRGQDFKTQLDYFLECFNSDGSHGDLAESVDLLQDRKLKKKDKSEHPEDLYHFIVDLTGRIFNTDSLFNPGRDFRYIVDSWMYHFDFNGPRNIFNRILNGVGAWLNPLLSANPGPFEPVITPLLRVVGKVLETVPNDVEQLEMFVGKEFARDDFPPLLADIETIALMDDPETDYLQKQLSQNSSRRSPSSPNSAEFSRQFLIDDEKRSSENSSKSESSSKDDLSDEGFVLRVLARAWNGPIERRFDENFVNTVKEWVIAKECVYDLKNLEDRVVSVLNAGRDDINNVEYVVSPDGTDLEIRKQWAYDDLKSQLTPLIRKFSNLEAAPGSKPALNAQLDFFKYFVQPPPDSSSQYSYKDPFLDEEIRPQFQPEWLINWFYDRAIDYRLITYVDPAGTLRVRIVNTLDLFELVTANGDFLAPWPINMNMGIQNLAAIGQAWGDVPQNQWPAQIEKQAVATGKAPFTIAQAIRNIKPPVLSSLTWAELFNLDDLLNLTVNVVGLPPTRSCVKPVRGEADMPKPSLLSSTIGALYFKILPNGGERRREFQINLYNVWQSIPVLDDNTPKDPNTIAKPSPENGYRKSYPEGLEFFRDLFYQLYFSTPIPDRGFEDDIAQGMDSNNLTVISYSNQLGTLRLVSRLIQNIHKDDPAFQDLFRVLLHAGLSRNFYGILSQFFGTDKGQDLFWNVLLEAHEVVNQGSELEVSRLQNLGFYLAGLLNRLQPWSPPTDKAYDGSKNPDFVENVLIALNQAFFTPQYEEFLTQDHDGFLKDMLTSKSASSLFWKIYIATSEKTVGAERAERFRALLNRFLTDTSSGGSSRIQNGMAIIKEVYTDKGKDKDKNTSLEDWRLFSRRADDLTNNPYYKRLDLMDALHPALLFLEESNYEADGSVREEYVKNLARTIRRNLAGRIEAKDLNQFFLYAKDSPEQVNQIFQTLTRYIGQGDRGELKEFLKVVQGRLSAPKY